MIRDPSFEKNFDLVVRGKSHLEMVSMFVKLL